MTAIAPDVPAATLPDAVPARQARALDLVLISFGLLFMEQACIRWVSSHMRLLAYFSNFVLLACFVGMGFGLLRARRPSMLPLTMPLLLLLCVLLNTLDLGIVINRQELTSAVYFGAEEVSQRAIEAPLPVMLGVAFVLISALFIGPGQAIGQTFESMPPLRAYTLNVGGSVLGVLGFMGASALSLSPAWWWSIGGVTVLWLLRDRRRALALSSICLIAAVALVARMEYGAIWSPYNRLSLVERETRGHKAVAILANNLTHQAMAPLDDPGSVFYDFPHLLNRMGRGVNSPGRMLVIGAGSGNDVAHALAAGAESIDAVDIDPRIQELGLLYHPAKPYADPRVTRTVNDGRAFLRQSTQQYDMVVYAVIDSLSLLSQFGAVRLENYLFTEEAFREVKARLAPHGLFAVYNFFRESWLAVRIYRTLQAVFGEDHVVMVVFPPRKVFEEQTDSVSLVLFMAGDVAKIRAVLDEARMQLVITPWMRSDDSGPRQVPFVAVTEVRASPSEFATDDWPFPYMRYRAVPAHVCESIATVVVVSTLMLFGFGGVRAKRIRPHFFFMGAAFMLIETEGIARLALLFGSTWINNSLTFLGILVIGLLANLVAARRQNLPYPPLYAGLFIALLLEYAVPLDVLLGLTAIPRAALGLLLLFMPVFFSGLIFARSIRESAHGDQDLGANVLGAVVGGCVENLSVILGYRALLLVVMGLYALSAMGLKRAPGPPT